MNFRPALTVLRAGRVESLHRAAVAVIDSSGIPLSHLGNPQTPVFLRSTAKIFQALPLISSGAADHYGLTDEEIAIACSSHVGDARHVDAVSRLLQKAGLSPGLLQCGIHLPFLKNAREQLCRHQKSPTVLQNNCSGKHAGMLAACKTMDWPLDSYLDPSHPLQVLILENISAFCSLPVEEIAVAIDGCSAPTYALPLVNLARGFARFFNGQNELDSKSEQSARRIGRAMVQNPELISGPGMLDCQIMKAFPGTILCKSGAEGVFAVALKPSEQFPKGLGIALKIEDGSGERAFPLVVLEILRQLKILSVPVPSELSDFMQTEFRNHSGVVVGRLETVFRLVKGTGVS